MTEDEDGERDGVTERDGATERDEVADGEEAADGEEDARSEGTDIEDDGAEDWFERARRELAESNADERSETDKQNAASEKSAPEDTDEIGADDTDAESVSDTSELTADRSTATGDRSSKTDDEEPQSDEPPDFGDRVDGIIDSGEDGRSAENGESADDGETPAGGGFGDRTGGVSAGEVSDDAASAGEASAGEASAGEVADGEVADGETGTFEEGAFGSGEGPDGDLGGGSGGEFGFASFGEGDDGDGSPPPSSGTDFEDTELDSDIERIDLGIEGLDEMILGGVPRRSLMTTIGSAGTGKTTFALQFLHKALTNGERGVYITLEESRDAILSTAEEKGYAFREYEKDGLLSVVSIDPIEMANSLASIGNELGRLIRDFDAERLVLDSVSLLEMMYDHPAKRRSEIFDFTRSLKEAGVTTMLISEASESNAYASRHGIVEYLTDAVFILQYVRPSDFRETRLAIEIQKIRNANHSRETKPYEITGEGISVYQQANIF